jgi:Winged helix DNA-binding domain
MNLPGIGGFLPGGAHADSHAAARAGPFGGPLYRPPARRSGRSGRPGGQGHLARPEIAGTGSYDEPVTRERLLAWRLANQHLAATRTADPAGLVTHFGAVQAQEYGQALWAVGLRTTQATVGTVEAAIERGAILRTWPMRGTIHFVAAGDARWLVELLAGRRIRQTTGVYRQIGLTDEVLRRSGEIVAGALRGGRRVRRKDLYSLLTGHGVDCSASPRGGRGGHILGYLSMTGLICLGPLDGRQQTFVLLDEWAPDARTPADPMAELAARYFTSHGPATVRDFGWWSGLNLTEAREAIGRAGPALAAAELDGIAYWHGAGQDPGPGPDGICLLPAFDEYTVAYSDRAVLAGGRPFPHGDLLNPVMVRDGLAVGLWRRTLGRAAVTIQLAPFGKISARDRERFWRAAERYAEFLGLPATITQAPADQVRRLRWQ